MKRLTRSPVRLFLSISSGWVLLSAAVDGEGVNVIVDFIGPDYWEKNVEAIAKDGRLVFLASMSGTYTSSSLPLCFLNNRNC